MNSSDAQPVELSGDPNDFYRAGSDAELFLSVAAPEALHVLEQLGPPPFRKTNFPLMGFLASLYEHVAEQVKG
jgi:hypothetical protein